METPPPRLISDDSWIWLVLRETAKVPVGIFVLNLYKFEIKSYEKKTVAKHYKLAKFVANIKFIFE